MSTEDNRPPVEWVEDEWQVWVDGDERNRHVFYRAPDVEHFLREQAEVAISTWNPLKSYRVTFDVLHVVRHHRTPPGDR